MGRHVGLLSFGHASMGAKRYFWQHRCQSRMIQEDCWSKRDPVLDSLSTGIAERRPMAEIVAIKPAAAEGPVAARLDKGVLRLTLANPPANVLSISVMAALTAELERAKADKTVRVIVLSATGKVFCAGHDLKEMTARRDDADEGQGLLRRDLCACAALMQAIVRHPRSRSSPRSTAWRPPPGCSWSRAAIWRSPRTSDLLHAGRQHRPLLLDADGGAVAQRLAQAGDGNALDRRDDRRCDRQGLRSGQSSRARNT